MFKKKKSNTADMRLMLRHYDINIFNFDIYIFNLMSINKRYNYSIEICLLVENKG